MTAVLYVIPILVTGTVMSHRLAPQLITSIFKQQLLYVHRVEEDTSAIRMSLLAVQK